MGKEKYGDLRRNPEIRRWYEDVSRGSRTTGQVYLRRLGLFCKITGKNPLDLLKMNEMQLANLLTDHVSLLEEKGHSGGYIGSIIKAIKSWLAFNGIKLPRKIKIMNAGDTPTLNDKGLFSQEDLRKVLDSTNIRGRVAISLIAFSGLRLQTLGNEPGTDGLRLGDLPELKINGDSVEFENIPTVIKVRKELSKKKHKYMTFLGPEGCEYVQLYLTERIKSGEILDHNSPLLTKSKFALRSEAPFLTRTKVSELIRRAIRTAGFDNRPYDLRPYFASRLLMAQDERLVQRDYRTFWMGHKGDIEHTYTTDRNLPTDQFETMRIAYSGATKHLETRHKALTSKDFEKMQNEIGINMVQTLFNVELTDKDKDDLFSLPSSDFWDRLKEISEGKKAPEPKGPKHKMVLEAEVIEYLDKGWELVNFTPKGDKAIIKSP